MFFIGDVHGQFGTYNWMISQMMLPGGGVGMDESIQVGDFGVFNDSDIDPPNLSPTHRFMPGNHDNPWICNMMDNCMGYYGYDENKDIFWTGGGLTIDKHIRTLGLDWWPEEELSAAEGLKVIELWAETRPRIMASHECPASLLDLMYTRTYGASNTSKLLDHLLTIHRPDHWVFGHHHVRYELVEDGTHFVGLNAVHYNMKESWIKIN